MNNKGRLSYRIVSLTKSLSKTYTEDFEKVNPDIDLRFCDVNIVDGNTIEFTS